MKAILRIPSFLWFSLTPGAKLTRFSLEGGNRVSGVTGVGSDEIAPFASHEVMLPSSVCSTSRVSGGVVSPLPSVLGLNEAREASAMAEASSVAPTFSPPPSFSGLGLFGDKGSVPASSCVSSITRLVEVELIFPNIEVQTTF